MACRVIAATFNIVSFTVIMVSNGLFAARGCPYGWVPFADSCYLGLDGSMKGYWSTAVMQCDRNNASIMVPSSDGENEFIFNSFQQHGYLKGVWINCNDAEVEGEWNCNEDVKYPTEYRKWAQNQPDDEKHVGDQDYGFMIIRDYKNNPDMLGHWGDVWKDYDMFIVCERPRQVSRSQSAMNMYCMTID
ncbi:asialoglycoprotein receptor 2-like [Asterias amurensis]|uniref:asialoglycoprotein receptor 2-like n=1 Tax=Asterias amurensis TaxID=7602 RepID=UPI003AB45DCA